MNSYFVRLMNKIVRERHNMELYRGLPEFAPEEPNPHEALQKAISVTQNERAKLAEMERYEDAMELNRILYTLYKKDARYWFDSFMIAMEWDREPENRFWIPRRKILWGHCEALQELSDRKIKELFLSQPPRTGKTTLILFYALWEMGRHNGETANLYCSYSSTLTTAFYNGALELITDPEYNFLDIFPECTVAGTNSINTTINLVRKRRYASLTCRSLQGTLNGATDASGGIIIGDDLISGIEEAMSPMRLEKAWQAVDNDLIPRGKENTCYLWIGTRWSIHDPIGIRLELLKTNPKYNNRKWKEITIPALDENGHSNFEYDYGVGFSTEYYERRRASFEAKKDEASWYAQYMNQPVERDGRLFNSADMRFYTELPQGEVPVRIFTAVDPAYGGGDSVAAAICYQYENDDIYVPDVMFDNRTKEYTLPILADLIKRHHVQAVRVEANKNTEHFADDLEDELKKIGYPIVTERKAAPTVTNMGKRTRIFDKSSQIKRYFVFVDANRRNKTYEAYMQEVYRFHMTQAKNVHDDAPDSLCMACEMAFKIEGIKTRISQRWF